MPLTPEDVSNKRFTPVRLREGYDMGEVDQFLDEVEAEMQRLIKERDDLGGKLAAAQRGGRGAAVVDEPAVKSAVKPAEAPAAKIPEKSAEKSAAPGSAAAAAPREMIKVVTAAEASSAAVRLLELATRNADEVVAEAKQEADQIVGAARTEAERLESETRSRTDTLEQEARTRTQNLDSETDTKRSELLGDMKREKARLDGEVETLRAFEREYRSRLKSYFNEQLQALDGPSAGGELPQGDASEPRRLQSILGDGKVADGVDLQKAEHDGQDSGENQQG